MDRATFGSQADLVPGFWDGKLLEVIGAAVEKRVASCKTQDPKQREAPQLVHRPQASRGIRMAQFDL